MATVHLQARRKSSEGRMCIHIRHSNHTMSNGGCRRAAAYQRYIERASAVDVLPSTEEPAEKATKAMHGNLGDDPNLRAAFWSSVGEMEHKNGRVQGAIILELPHEVSPEGRMRILESFLDAEFGSRGLPHWAVIHRPDVQSDPRNYHVHVVYYPRPGERRADGGWSFAAERGAAKVQAGSFPWGTKESPSKRRQKLERQIARAKDPRRRAELEKAIELTVRTSEEHRTRRPADRGSVQSKSRAAYPWGTERPSKRQSRLEGQIAKAIDPVRRSAYEAELAAALAFRARTSPPEQRKPHVQDREWIGHLRDSWCNACNEVIAEEGFAKRYHPGSYADLGINAEPTEHLGTMANAREAMGLPTEVGRRNDGRERRNRLEAGESKETIEEEAVATVAARQARWARMQTRQAEQRQRPDHVARWQAVESEATRRSQDASMAMAKRPPSRTPPAEGPRIGSALPEPANPVGLDRQSLVPAATETANPPAIPRPEAVAPALPKAPPSNAQQHPPQPTAMAKPAVVPAPPAANTTPGPPKPSTPTKPPTPASPRPQVTPTVAELRLLALLVPAPTSADERVAWRRKLEEQPADANRRALKANQALLARRGLSPEEQASVLLGAELLRETEALRTATAEQKQHLTRRIETKWAYRGVLAATERLLESERVLEQATKPIAERIKAFDPKRPARVSLAANRLSPQFHEMVSWQAPAKDAYARTVADTRNLEAASIQLRASMGRQGGLSFKRHRHLAELFVQASSRTAWIPYNPEINLRVSQAVRSALDPGSFKTSYRPGPIKVDPIHDEIAEQERYRVRPSREAEPRTLTRPSTAQAARRQHEGR